MKKPTHQPRLRWWKFATLPLTLAAGLLVAGSTLAAASVHAAETASGDVGKNGFTTYCQACHQENGEGMAGALPPLTN